MARKNCRSPGGSVVTDNESGIITKISPQSVADTVARFTDTVGVKGVKVFAVIDQTAAAREVGLQLRVTTLVIFGSPAAGPPGMDAPPPAARHLPLKGAGSGSPRQTTVTH